MVGLNFNYKFIIDILFKLKKRYRFKEKKEVDKRYICDKFYLDEFFNI